MYKHLRTFLAYLLAIAIVVTNIPMSANAEDAAEDVVPVVEAENTETSEEPQVISELTEKRDEVTKYFAMSDGTIKACIYPQNVHYLEDGTYEEIDNTLVKSKKDGKNYYENKKNSFSAKIPESLKDDYVEFSDENGYVKFKLLGASNQKLEKVEKSKESKNADVTKVKNVNDRATFKAVKGDVDITYDLAGNKLKETIVLSKKTKQSFVFDIKTSAAKAVVNNDNSISFFDKDGMEIYQMQAPYMSDAAGEYSNAVQTKLEKSKDGYTLTYAPDYKWLSEKERVYPVEIDPTLIQAIYKETVTDTYVGTMQNASNPDIRGGWDVLNIGKRTTRIDGQQIVMRGYIKFAIPSEIGANDCIVDAKLDLLHYTGGGTSVNGTQIDVHELTSSFSEGNTWWGNQPSYDPIITDYAIVNTGNYFAGSSFSYDSYNLTRLVNKWHNGGTNHGIVLKYHSDNADVSSSQQVYYFAKQSVYYGSVSKFVEITYRNTTGLEDYWSYTTQDFGQYGTGYVNNYNGNLVYVHDDVTFNSGINGFTLSHVYNTNQSGKGAGYYGSGWRLNLVQKLEPVTVTGYSNVKYKYTDGDGTEHYLVETSDGKIVDEDGLGYTYESISEGELSKKLTDKNGNVLKFDWWNYLRKIIDANGNTISLNYRPIPNVDNYLATITTSSGGIFTLDYDSDYKLTSITDNAGRKTTYTYTSGNLTGIQYPDGSALTFKYHASVAGVSSSIHWLQSIIAPDGREIRYEHYGQTGKIYWDWYLGSAGESSAWHYFYYSQNQTKLVDQYKKSITYQFDTFGRPTCVYDDNQNIYSQTYQDTTTSGSRIFNNNKLKSSSNGNTYVNNLLGNAVFSNDMTGWLLYNEGGQCSVVSSNGLITSKSVKITSDNKTTNVIMQGSAVTSKCTYTFSGYIKAENVQSGSHGAALEVIVDGASGTKWYYSDFITGTTDSEIDNGFQRVSVTFTLEEGESINRLTAGIYNASGTVYIDSLQLEEGDIVNQINLIDNSSFERHSGTHTTPSGYIGSYGNSGASLDVSKSGSVSCKVTGVGTEVRRISQRLYLPGKAGDVYTVGGWAKANAVSNHAKEVDDANFTLYVCAYSVDGTKEWVIPKFNEYVSDWQFVSKTFVLTKEYTSLQVYCVYDYNGNTAYFDNLFLYRDTMQSYTYDGNGNVVSTLDYASQNQTFEYKKNNLSKLIHPDGSFYEYYYDSHNNMTLSRSSEGVQYKVDYDSTGNPVATTISSNANSTSLTEGKVYYIRNKLSGKYIDIDTGAEGTNIFQNDFSGAVTQKWKLISNHNGSVSLVNQVGIGRDYMTVSGCESADGSNIHGYIPPNGDAFILKAESLKIEPASEYTYKIMTAASNYSSCVEVSNSATAEGGNIDQWNYTGTDAQQWYFEDVEQPPASAIESGTIYQFRARNSGKYLNLKDGSIDIGTAVQQYTYNNTDAQKYILNRYEDTDYYTITAYKDRTKLLEISSDVNSIGYRYLQLGDSMITDSKLFKLEYNADMQGFYIIPKANEAWVLDVANYSIADHADLIFTGKAPTINRFFLAEKVSNVISSSATYQDNGNYPHTVTDSRGNTTTYTYDTKRGLQTGVINAKGGTTEYTYNSKNDRLENVKTGDSAVKYQYNTVGMLQNITSPSGTTYHFNYDAFGRQSKISVGSQMLSETLYRDNYLALVSRFNYGNGAYKNYSYDNQNRLISESVNELTSRMYLYDKSGNVAEINDLLANVTTRFQYDLIGRVVGIKASDGQSMRFVYDKYNRLSLSKWTMGDISLSNGYIYGDSSVAGQKNGLIYGVNLNGAQKLGYGYDDLSRLQNRTVGTETPFVTEYTYLEGKDSNTTTTLVKTVKNGADTLEYTYDELGNITTVSKNGIVIEQYSYDELNQLKSAVYGEDTYQYFYDNGGNLTEIKKNNEVIKSYSYGNSEWKDLLTSFNGEAITYDEIGNPLTYRNGMSFTWQNGRQLAGISKDGAELASYTYNAEGLRTSKTVNGVTTDYYWLNGTLQGQKTGEESILFLYDENGNAYGFIVKNGTGESTYYYEFNVQGDIIGIIDSTGTKVVEYTYGAWGDILSVTGALADTIGQMNPLRYRGYYYDAETGFYYLTSRYYDAETGRFINADGAIAGAGGKIGGYNLYSYCFNNPVNMSDLAGNWPKWLKEIGARAKYLAGFVVGVVTAPIKAIKADIGLGIGLGIKASTNVKGIKIDGGASASITDSVSYDKGKVDVKNTTSTKIGVNALSIINAQYMNGKEHSFFDNKCNCNIIHTPFVTQSHCVANKKIQRTETTLGISVGAYLCLGGEVSVGIDLGTWYNELIDVLNEPYISPYY